MADIQCRHCGNTFDEALDYCPACRTPSPARQARDMAPARKRFLYAFIGLIIFSIIMILILPRD